MVEIVISSEAKRVNIWRRRRRSRPAPAAAPLLYQVIVHASSVSARDVTSSQSASSAAAVARTVSHRLSSSLLLLDCCFCVDLKRERQRGRSSVGGRMAAFQTMNAIKRKMHKLKTDKENEYDRVDQLEQKLIELRCLNEKVVRLTSSQFTMQ